MNELLSEREIEILRLAADGCAGGEIANRLSVSVNTIKWYSKRIYEKLGVETRTQAIKRAQTLGLFNDSSRQTQPIQPRDNLPSPLTAFVGRRAEVDTVKQLLKQHRLLTLTGPGGIGKTRLALQVAEELPAFFQDGVYFVNLAAIHETSLVINTIGHVLGVAESLDTPLLALTQAYLRDKHLLLVLDNFEHLIEAAPVVADLLVAARNLTILLTSREVLALYGEQEYAVPPLQLPNLEWFAAPHVAPGDLINSESLQLFERCAQAVDPTFRLTAANAAAIASLCLRLDGLPLAIELAAAYVKLLSPQAMLTQLDALWLEMKRGVRNVPARQQTLRNTIDWSYRFLNAEERRLFAQLAVFRGGCTVEAIYAICDSPCQASVDGAWTGTLLQALNGLINKSLVWRRVGLDGQTRFGMLETIREYALLCLQASGEVEALQQRHAYYYAQLIARVESLRIKQRLILDQLGNEVDNFRVAMRWALTHDPEPGLSLLGDMGSCWRIRGYLTEGMAWAQQLLAVAQRAPVPTQARAYASAAVLAYVLGRRQQACQLADQGWLLAQQTKDQIALAHTTFVRAAVLVAPNLTPAVYEEIVRLTNEAASLFATLENPMNYARTFNLLGEVQRMQQRYAEAVPLYEESLRGLRAVDYQSGVAIVLANLGWVVYHLGNYRAALVHFTESVELAYDLGFTDGVAVALIGVAGALTRLEYTHQAAQLLGTAEAIQKALGVGVTAADELDYQQTRAELQAQLGHADFDRCWQTGRTRPLAAAMMRLNEFCSAQRLSA